MDNKAREHRYEWIGEPFDYKEFSWKGKKFFVLDKETSEKILVVAYNVNSYKPVLVSKLNNKQFIDFCADTAPDIFVVLSKDVQNAEMQEKIAKATKQFDMFRYMNLDKLLTEGGEEKLEEVCLILIKRFGNAICYLEDKFMTSKILDEAVLYHRSGLSKIDLKYKDLYRCILSVAKWGTTLKSVPKEYWDSEVEYLGEKIKLYELAIKADGLALKLLSVELKTLSICKTAVKSNSEAIVYVPPKYITPEFIQELYDEGVNISSKNMEYVNESLKIYAENNGIFKAEEILTLPDSLESKSSEQYQKYKDISLENFSKIINKETLQILFNKGIKTLDDLLNLSSNPEFIKMFPKISYTTINGNINILNCKLFNTNPMIDFNVPITSELLSNKLGISSRIGHKLEDTYNEKTLGYLATVILLKDIELPNIINPNDIQYIETINQGIRRRFSEETFNELYEKFSILINYYKNRQSSIIDLVATNLIEGKTNNGEENTLEKIQDVKIVEILKEMSEINKEMSKLNARIAVLNETLQQLNTSEKGVSRRRGK